jgi:hypothetical protein
MNVSKIVENALNDRSQNSVKKAVNAILGESVSVGTSVAVIDDPISGYTGAKGKVKSISDANPGFASVELENGSTVQMQTSLLIPV